MYVRPVCHICIGHAHAAESGNMMPGHTRLGHLQSLMLFWWLRSPRSPSPTLFPSLSLSSFNTLFFSFVLPFFFFLFLNRISSPLPPPPVMRRACPDREKVTRRFGGTHDGCGQPVLGLLHAHACPHPLHQVCKGPMCVRTPWFFSVLLLQR